jgi:hypothetical protein
MTGATALQTNILAWLTPIAVILVIILPQQFDGAPLQWARNRESLWNTAERAEKRHNARVAREYQLSLPAELSAAQRIAVARIFSRRVAQRYNVAVDLAVHEPRAGGDPRNFHAHLLSTTREVTPAGLGAKAGLDMRPVERRRRQLADHRQEYLSLREQWATLVNEALREANVAARVDHRSLAAQGIDREPLPRIPLAQLKMEQRGVRSELAERLRSEYRGRLQSRLQRTAESAPPVPQAVPQPVKAAELRDTQVPRPAPVQDLEEIRRQAREAWLRMRPRQADAADDKRAAREHDAQQPLHPSEDELAR